MEIYKPGTVLFGKYEIINVFRGAMGIIYAVINLNRKTYFELPFLCLKTYMPGLISDESRAKELFMKEIETWMLIGKYDVILNAYKTDFIEDRPYVFLQYADSGTLFDLSMKDFDPLNNLKDQTWSFSLLWHFATGLNKIYKTINRCHGDLHLSNIFLANGGMLLKIGDFGLTALKQQSNAKSIKDEKINIIKILWFLLTGLDENIQNIKKSKHLDHIPKAYRLILLNYINNEDASLSILIKHHLDLHRDYIYQECGIMPLLPEEHHANVQKAKINELNKIFGGLGVKTIKSEHIQWPVTYYNEAQSLFYAGNKEKSLDRFMKFLKYHRKKFVQKDE